MELGRRTPFIVTLGFLGIACARNPATVATPSAAPAGFGAWTQDGGGLPAFDLDPARLTEAPWAPFAHVISAGRVSALVDRWGNVRLFTTVGGTTTITPVTTRTRGGLFATFEREGELVSFVHSELPVQRRVRYGTGYAAFAGETRVQGQPVAIEQEIWAAPLDRACLGGVFTIHNRGAKPIEGRLVVESDVFVRPGPAYADFVGALAPRLGPSKAAFATGNASVAEVFLAGPSGFTPETRGHALRLGRDVRLAPSESLTVPVSVGYGDERDCRRFITGEERSSDVARLWRAALAPVEALWAPEPWMREEAVWSFGQLLSFRSFDAAVALPYFHLGGYALFRNPDDPQLLSFPVREAAENALGMLKLAPLAAKESLRWLAAGQLASGDIPKNTNLRRDRDPSRMHQESDSEIWFLLASSEDPAALAGLYDERVPFWDGGEASYWEHLVRAYRWLREGIGVGAHGLVLMKDGDWNDYLSRVGRSGRGESLMNTAMAVRACERFAKLAQARGDAALARDAAAFSDSLRSSAARGFDGDWFIIGYDDEGRPLGDRQDRLYLNSQSWAALAKVGTAEQRQRALRAALRENASPIGLTLLSKPYASPPPDGLSFAVLPAGEGENGGIWPQTVYWMVWALAEEGLSDEAVALWQAMSLRNHARRFPTVPFGIWNGPDCYSSAMAGPAHGWTQVQVFDRMTMAPSNPIVAWQAFALEILGRARPAAITRSSAGASTASSTAPDRR